MLHDVTRSKVKAKITEVRKLQIMANSTVHLLCQYAYSQKTNCDTHKTIPEFCPDRFLIFVLQTSDFLESSVMISLEWEVKSSLCLILG